MAPRCDAAPAVGTLVDRIRDIVGVPRPATIVCALVIGGCRHAEAEIDLNARVLALVAEYPERGFGGYVWPDEDGRSGTTRDLTVGEHVIARHGEGTHCVGMTFEVFWRALAACPGDLEATLDPLEARALQELWYVPAIGRAGAAEALPAHALGERIERLDDARPGDFVQAWSTSGAGHSMVLLGWDQDDSGTITGIHYWSSQPWTEGIGVSHSPIGAGDDAFDPAQIHVARARCPRVHGDANRTPREPARLFPGSSARSTAGEEMR